MVGSKTDAALAEAIYSNVLYLGGHLKTGQ
jgi:hypothetical protein